MTHQISAIPRDPIIVDEESGILPETVIGDGQESTGSNTGFESLVSLTSYDKRQNMAYDYSDPTTRPNQAPNYASFAQPTYDAQYMSTHAQVPNGLPNAAELPMLSGGEQYEAHDSSYPQQNAQYLPTNTYDSRPAPEVTNFEPSQGQAGRKLFVYLNAPQDLETSGQFPTVLFGSRRCSGMLTRLDGPNQQGTHAITVDVPAFAATGSQDTNVSLSIDSNDLSGASMPVMFGNFKYTDATPYPMTSPSSSGSRKRKLSLDQSEHSPSKRSTSQTLRAGDQFDTLTSSPMSSNALSPYSPNQQAVNYAYGHTPSRPQTFGGMPQAAPQATPRYGASPQSSAPHLHIQPPTSDFIANPGYIQERPGIATSLAGHSPGTTSMSPAPTLVRTSTLQNDGSSPHSLSAPFNPYAMYPSTNKAVLKLDGELNSMCDNWTQEEISTQRRLVRFRRDQRDNQLHASFEPVTIEDHSRAPGNIYVNCIYWKEKGACYITSVDTIQLLESLVGVRFTVEEKNRIRRNLEGFRPATVSKTRPDCEEFFKLIMGFPSPKPRNIEKDVKVFPWRILPHALKKIIGKYSASYSSTAGTIHPPGQLGSSAAPINVLNMHRHATASPQPGAHPHHTSSAVSSPAIGSYYPTTSHHLPSTGVMAPVVPSSSWHQPVGTGYASHPEGVMGSVGMTAGGRGSWDFGTGFMDGQQGHAMGAQAGVRDYRIPSISQWGDLGFVPRGSTQA